MQNTRTPNIAFKRNKQMKGRDIIPFKSESLGRIDIGPRRKHFVIPIELDIILITKDKRGRDWLILSNQLRVNPDELRG